MVFFGQRPAALALLGMLVIACAGLSLMLPALRRAYRVSAASRSLREQKPGDTEGRDAAARTAVTAWQER
jgi:hypothetical protein